jgi:hypothetical protein
MSGMRESMKCREMPGQFAEVQKVSSLFSGLSCHWFICGGWALDLFLNRVTRKHKDVDVGFARRDQLQARAYLQQRGWSLEKAVDGALLPWLDEEWLVLPMHCVWCRNEQYEPAFVELLFNEVDDTQFRFRRDQSITLPRERMCLQTLSGLPVLAPEIALLYKASDPAEADADFQNTVAALSAEQRGWLKDSLNKLYTQHPWAARL